MFILVLDSTAPQSIGATPKAVAVRAMGADGLALAGPLLFLPSADLMPAGLIAASPAVLGGKVWLCCIDPCGLHLAPGAVLGHAAPLAALPVSPAPAPPAHASQAQSKAKGRPSAAPDPTA